MYVYIVFTADLNSTKVLCTLDTECTQAQACIRGVCVDLCTNNCGKASQCIAQAHTVRCICPPGFTGNASIECLSVDTTNPTEPEPTTTESGTPLTTPLDITFTTLTISKSYPTPTTTTTTRDGRVEISTTHPFDIQNVTNIPTYSQTVAKPTTSGILSTEQGRTLSTDTDSRVTTESSTSYTAKTSTSSSEELETIYSQTLSSRFSVTPEYTATDSNEVTDTETLPGIQTVTPESQHTLKSTTPQYTTEQEISQSITESQPESETTISLAYSSIVESSTKPFKTKTTSTTSSSTYRSPTIYTVTPEHLPDDKTVQTSEYTSVTSTNDQTTKKLESVTHPSTTEKKTSVYTITPEHISSSDATTISQSSTPITNDSITDQEVTTTSISKFTHFTSDTQKPSIYTVTPQYTSENNTKINNFSNLDTTTLSVSEYSTKAQLSTEESFTTTIKSKISTDYSPSTKSEFDSEKSTSGIYTVTPEQSTVSLNRTTSEIEKQTTFSSSTTETSSSPYKHTESTRSSTAIYTVTPEYVTSTDHTQERNVTESLGTTIPQQFTPLDNITPLPSETPTLLPVTSRKPDYFPETVVPITETKETETVTPSVVEIDTVTTPERVTTEEEGEMVSEQITTPGYTITSETVTEGLEIRTTDLEAELTTLNYVESLTSPSVKPLVTCEHQDDCLNNQTCIRNQCINPCDHYKPCAENISCESLAHVPVCLCPLFGKQVVVDCRIFPGKHTLELYYLWEFSLFARTLWIMNGEDLEPCRKHDKITAADSLCCS